MNTSSQFEKEKNDYSYKLRIQVCPKCRNKFELSWIDYGNKPQTLIIDSCLSGGVYAVEISCPHCDYKEEL